MTKTASLFISAVTSEFGAYRRSLRQAVETSELRVESQESFLDQGVPKLVEISNYIRECEGVAHLLGVHSGSLATEFNREKLLQQLPDLPGKLGLEPSFLNSLTFTQWEAWLAIYHGRKLHIAQHLDSQVDPLNTNLCHLEELRQRGYYPAEALRFRSESDLQIAFLRVWRELRHIRNALKSPELPPSLGDLFRGRSERLAELRDYFTQADAAPNGSRLAMVAIWGMGGLGKTRLATEFAHATAHEHEALLFVSAENEDVLDNHLANLCHVLRLSESASTDQATRVKAALRWLENPEHQRWLLIVDNVDDLTARKAVFERLRSLPRGHVILTGRLREWPNYVKPISLDLLSEEDAAQYLLDSTDGVRLPDPGGFEVDRRLAVELAAELGGLALGLVQASSAIRRRVLSFADYLEDWRQTRAEMLEDKEFDPELTGYPRSVAYTWQTSYAQLPALSKLLFDGLCWLSPEPIPERLVSQNWPAAALAAVPAELQASLPKRTRELLLPLYDYCLADQPHSAARLFSVHRVLQDAGRRWQQRAEGAAAANSALMLATALLLADFDRPSGTQNLVLHRLDELRPFVPHALQLLDNKQVPTIDCCRFARMLSEMAYTTGDLAAAVKEAERAIKLGRSAVQEQATNELALNVSVRAQCQWIFVLEAVGRFSDALQAGEILLAEVAGWEDSSETEKLDICSLAQSYVGRVRENRGEQDQALALFEASREIREKLCAREPDNLAHQRELGIALNNVGRVREKRGEQDQALALFEASREISEKLCAREPDNLAHQRDLGIALCYCGFANWKLQRKEMALERLQAAHYLFESLCQTASFYDSHSNLQVVRQLMNDVKHRRS